MRLTYSFLDVITGIKEGDFSEGVIFTAESGHRIIYKEGVLSWMTANGYASNAVTINDELLAVTFTLDTTEGKIKTNFTTALQHLAKGVEIVVISDSFEYTLSSFYDLDNMLKEQYFESVYHADCYIDKSKADVPVQATEESPIAQLDDVGRKLSLQDAYHIHILYHSQHMHVDAIAEKFGVSSRLVYYILEGKRWETAYRLFNKVGEVPYGENGDLPLEV